MFTGPHPTRSTERKVRNLPWHMYDVKDIIFNNWINLLLKHSSPVGASVFSANRPNLVWIITEILQLSV